LLLPRLELFGEAELRGCPLRLLVSDPVMAVMPYRERRNEMSRLYQERKRLTAKGQFERADRLARSQACWVLCGETDDPEVRRLLFSYVLWPTVQMDKYFALYARGEEAA
jgi:hypothetical protein